MSFKFLHHVPNAITITDEQIATVYYQMHEDKVFKAFFYDGDVTLYEFARKVRRDDHWFYVAWDTDKNIPLMFAICNCISGKTCVVHFCALAEGMSRADEVVEAFKTMMKKGGIISLIGVTPKPYRHALNFIYSMGFEYKTNIKGSCIMAHYNNRICDGILTVCEL